SRLSNRGAALAHRVPGADHLYAPVEGSRTSEPHNVCRSHADYFERADSGILVDGAEASQRTTTLATLEVVSRTSLAAVGLFRFLRDRGYELRLYRFSAIWCIQAFSTDPDRNALSDIGPAFDSQRAGLSPLLPVVCWLCLYHLGAAD